MYKEFTNVAGVRVTKQGGSHEADGHRF
jgi:hypothetical protein